MSRFGITNNPHEKKEKENSIDFKEEGVGEWHATQAQAQSGAVIDPGVGQDRVIRHFIIYPNPANPDFTESETLRGVLPTIKRAIIKDGWTFDREPTIEKLKDGFAVRTVLRPAIKNGTIIGATNAKPRNASDLLKEANVKNKK